MLKINDFVAYIWHFIIKYCSCKLACNNTIYYNKCFVKIKLIWKKIFI